MEMIFDALILFVVIKLIFNFLRKFISSLKSTNYLVQALNKINSKFYDSTSIYIVLKFLEFSSNVDKWIDSIFLAIFVFQLIAILESFSNHFFSVFLHKNKEEALDPSVIQIINTTAKILIWCGALVFFLSNIGVNVNSLVASLGIGGIAVALASQSILGDIFSSFSIYFDKPFVVGDLITVGADSGTVRKIGLKTTRLESVQGEELIISNKELTSARVQNFRKMIRRRVAFNLLITHDTPITKCEMLTDAIKNLLKNTTKLEIERVVFKEIGEYGLVYEIIYYHLSNDYNECLNQRQTINLQIKQILLDAQIQLVSLIPTTLKNV